MRESQWIRRYQDEQNQIHMPDSCREQILERAFAQQNPSPAPTAQKAGAASFHAAVQGKQKAKARSNWRMADWSVGIGLLTAIVMAAVGSMMLLGVRNPAMQPPSEGLVMEAFSDSEESSSVVQYAENMEKAEEFARGHEEALKNGAAKSRQDTPVMYDSENSNVTEYQIGEAFSEDSGLIYYVNQVSCLSLDQTLLTEMSYDPADFYDEDLQQQLWENYPNHVFLSVQMAVTYSAVSDDQPEEILPQLRFDVQPPLQNDACRIVYLDQHAQDYADLNSYCQMEKPLVLEESQSFILGIVVPRVLLGNQQIFLVHYNEYGEADGRVNLNINSAYQKQAILKKALEPYRNFGKLSGEIVASIGGIQSNVSFAVNQKTQQYSSQCSYENDAESPAQKIIYTYDNQGECDEVTEHYDESGNLENTEHFHDPKKNSGTFPKSQYENWVNGSVGFLPTAEIAACLENMDNWEIDGVWQADGRNVVQIAGTAPENSYDFLQFSMILDVATGVCMEFTGWNDKGEGLSIVGQNFQWESEADAPMQFDIAMFPDAAAESE